MGWDLASSRSILIVNHSTSAWRNESSTCMTFSTLTLVSGAPRLIGRILESLDCHSPRSTTVTNVASLYAADIEALQSGSKYIKQLIPAVVNLVYKKLLQYDITSRAFHTRNTADETTPDKEWLDEETPQIQRRKMFLRWYLIKLCSDPTSIDFWRYLSKVGYVNRPRRDSACPVRWAAPPCPPPSPSPETRLT